MSHQLTITALTFVFVATGLSAQVSTFAQIVQAQPGQVQPACGNSQNSKDTLFNTENLSTGIDVTFDFSPTIAFSGALAALNGPQSAKLILKATPEKSCEKSVDSGVLELLLTTPVDGKDVLLEATFSDAFLLTYGKTGLALSAGNGKNTGKVTYSSDFLNFNNSTPDCLTLALLGLNSKSIRCHDDMRNAFQESFIIGTFNGDVTSVPEPGTYGLIAALISLAFVSMRRRWTRPFAS